MKSFKRKAKKAGAFTLALSMIVGLLAAIPGGAFAVSAKAADAYIEETTEIIYGTNGGTPNVTFEGSYTKQGDVVTGNDLVAAGGAVKWTNLKYHSAGYGVSVGNGASLDINVKGSTKITFVTSKYNSAGKMITAISTDAKGTFEVPEECKVAADGDRLTVTYTAGDAESATLTLSFGGTVYVPALIIEPVKELVCVEENTEIIYGTKGGTPNFTFEGTYSTQGDALTGNDVNAANGAVKWTNGKWHSAGYGVFVGNGASLDINVKGSAKITFVTSQYNNSGKLITATSTDAKGTFEVPEECKVAADGDRLTVTYTAGDAESATLTLSFGGTVYIPALIIEPVSDEPKPPVVLDTSKIDVWDFGAEALDAAKYNNNLTVDIINAFYPGVAPGTASQILKSFTAKDGAGKDAVKFNDGGKTNNRLRTTNTAVTRYDDKSLTDEDGNTYTGYVYSNSSGAETVNLEIYLYEGDILTTWLGSNGGDAVYELKGPDGKAHASFNYTSGKARKATFYAGAEGWYKLWCTNEKLVCARILREHVPVVAVSGTVTAPGSIPSGYKLVFTNTITKKATECSVDGGSYTVDLCGKYSYDVSLKDANGFVVSAASNAVTLESADKTHDISIESVDIVTLTGNVTGLDDKLADMELTFTSDKVYVPEFDVDTAGAYTLKLEKGVTYAVTADGVNDYTLNTTEISASADGTKNIEFTKKPVYDVTVTVKGITDTTGVRVTFANIAPEEEGYEYTFGIGDKIQLRDGQYKVTLGGIAKKHVEQGTTADAKINGAGTTVTIPVEELPPTWDFAKMNTNTAIENIDGQDYYSGLKLKGVAINKTYLLANASTEAATITIPDVTKGSVVTIKYCYTAAFDAGDVSVDEKSGSTSQIDSVQATAAEDGDFVITTSKKTSGSQTYFCSIEVSDASSGGEYRDTLQVGPDKEFSTINDALAAVRDMSRTADQAVTIMIDPGDYEEMLVIDTPNIKLVNASKTPSIALKDKGVGIDDNAVRVTWYYGHGYTYYSMGPDCKYDKDLLAVNKANGYASFKNPGSGTTNGSYWNATVVITADKVTADGIIFENSFNQYVSAKSVEDVIEAQSGAKEGTVARASMKTVGDTKVQEKEYVERAAALSIYNDKKEIYFNNCKFIGRQDTLYGGVGVTAGFNKCDILGGTDYIFGGMTAVFKNCNLMFNTNDQTSKGEKDDVGYITAPQQSSGRGYLMYECRVTSTTPGVDTASNYTSKPGYFGRPWQGKTGEAVFYKTTVDAADAKWASLGESLIAAVGWNSSLGGESELCGEYGTIEKANVDNTGSRAGWAKVFTEPALADGSPITIETFLGSWNPFGDDNNDDEIVVEPDDTGVVPVEGVTASDDTSFVDENDNPVTDGTIVIKADAIVDADKAVMETAVETVVNAIPKDAEVKGTVYMDISAIKGGTKVNIKTGKLTLTLAIPDDITYDAAKDTVKVLHNTVNGLIEHVVTKGAGRNISIEVDSLSPFAIVVYGGAEVTPPQPEQPSTQTPGDSDNNNDSDDGDDDKEEVTTQAPTLPVQPTVPAQPSTQAPADQTDSAATGDSTPIALFMLLAVISAGALCFTSKKRI